MPMQNFTEFHQFVLMILGGNEIPTIIKGHNSIVNLRKLTRENSNLYQVKVYACAKSGVFLSIRPQVIERKPNSDDKQGP